MIDYHLIHIVDDDASLRRALTFLLESAGWRVTAHESAEAFLAARRSPAPTCARWCSAARAASAR
jgi:FixJ family two-component response regulator